MGKTLIYYFTGTGNSLIVSRLIEKLLGNTTLIHMAKQTDKDITEDISRVGLIFPVYVFGLPRIVERCIANLHIKENLYSFVVVTHGGIPAASVLQAKEVFLRNQMNLSAGFELLMVDNATMNADIIPKKKQYERFKKAERRIHEICSYIEKSKTYMFKGSRIFNKVLSGLYFKVKDELPGFDKNFRPFKFEVRKVG